MVGFLLQAQSNYNGKRVICPALTDARQLS